MKAKFITDSSCLIPLEQLLKEDVGIFESLVIIEGKEHRELTEMNREDFINSLPTVDPYPTTSQVTTKDVLAEFEKAIEEKYESIFYMALTPEISNAYNVARLAAKRVQKKIEVRLYQTDHTTGSQGAMVYRALEMRKKGKSVDEIIEHLNELKHNIVTIGMTGDVESLFKTGKVKRGSIKGIMVSLFNMVPIAQSFVGEGFIGTGAAFSQKSAMKKIIKTIKELTKADQRYDLFMADALNPELKDWIIKEIKEARSISKVFHWEMSPVMALSAGKGAVTATLSPSMDD